MHKHQNWAPHLDEYSLTSEPRTRAHRAPVGYDHASKLTTTELELALMELHYAISYNYRECESAHLNQAYRELQQTYIVRSNKPVDSYQVEDWADDRKDRSV